MIALNKMNEWMLVITFRDALKDEDYNLASRTKDEMKRRIDSKQIDLSMAIDGFRRHDTGEVNHREFTPLFEGIREAFPEHFTRKSQTDYLLSIPINSRAITKLKIPASK